MSRRSQYRCGGFPFLSLESIAPKTLLFCSVLNDSPVRILAESLRGLLSCSARKEGKKAA